MATVPVTVFPAKSVRNERKSILFFILFFMTIIYYFHKNRIRTVKTGQVKNLAKAMLAYGLLWLIVGIQWMEHTFY